MTAAPFFAADFGLAGDAAFAADRTVAVDFVRAGGFAGGAVRGDTASLDAPPRAAFRAGPADFAGRLPEEGFAPRFPPLSLSAMARSIGEPSGTGKGKQRVSDEPARLSSWCFLGVGSTGVPRESDGGLGGLELGGRLAGANRAFRRGLAAPLAGLLEDLADLLLHLDLHDAELGLLHGGQDPVDGL